MEVDIIKKQVVLFIALVTCLMLVMSGVSAADTDAISDSQNSLLSNDISDIAVGANDLASTGDKAISVKVNYEFADDGNTKLIPDFSLVSNDKYLNFTKTYDVNTKSYILHLADFDGDSLSISAMTAGYVTDSKVISGADLTDDVLFDLKATEAYKLGRTVTEIADNKLDFKNADDVIAITTAGVAKLNGKTSEDAMEAIVNYGVAYSNVIMLRQSATDPIDFAFIVKYGNDLKAIVFQNAATEYVYLGTISEDMSKSEWNNYYNAVAGENAWSFASLANGWAAGVSREILQEAAFHGHICEGTLGGYSIIQALLKFYPPEQETNPGGIGSPADVTAYKVLGVPGGSDDDAAIFFLDDTIGKTGYTGMNTTNTGATENMIGFIKWNSKAKTGDLIIMSFNSTNLKNKFTTETGINPDDGSLEELKYCSWWINQINNNPENLVDILYEFSGLNQEQYNYLMGTTENVTYDGEPAEYGLDGHGLDLDYILSLGLASATRATPADNNQAKLSDAEIKQIGIDAANEAKKIFKEELGIDIDRDDVDFLALTDAGYAFLNGQDTVIARDGLYEVFGGTLYSQNVLSLHQAVWKPLWFAFAIRYPDSDVVNMIYLRYNPETQDFFVGELDGDRVVDIGFETLNNSAKLRAIEKSFVPDGNWFNVQTIVNAWNEHPLFDQMATFLYHAHVCPGVQPGFFITDYIQEKYPLGENESYTYIASNIFCKDDSLTYLLDLSPGLGTFYVQKLPSNETVSPYIEGGNYQGVLVVWDDNLKVGKASTVSFKWGTIDSSMYGTSEASRANQIKAYIDMYAGVDNPNIKAEPIVSTDDERWINEDQFNMLRQGAGEDFNAITYLKSLDETVTKEDVIKANEANSNSNSNTNGTDSSSNSNSNSNSNANSNSNSNANSISPSSSTSRPSSSSGVGTSGAVASSAPVSSDDSSQDNSDDSNTKAGKAKSYSVSKTPATKSADSSSLIYALVGVLAIGAVLGFGYMRRKK